eukprot:15366157-Ditylum_brightwellii.AAC.1
MVETVQTSVETAISPSTNSTVQMKNSIKKSVVEEIACSTITEEGNTTSTPKEIPAKDISDDNTNTTATSSQESTSDSSSDQANKTEEMPVSAQQKKKSNALPKSVLI